jgi:hypothetical protein
MAGEFGIGRIAESPSSIAWDAPTGISGICLSKPFDGQPAPAACTAKGFMRHVEAGTAQPTRDALVSLAKALHVSLDDLVFEEDERGPNDDMRLQFEAVSQLPEEDRKIVKALIEGMVIKYQARRMVENLSS